MTSIEDSKFKSEVLSRFFIDAYSIAEIAFKYDVPERTIIEILQEEQNSTSRTVPSSKFRKKVADFASKNPQASIAKVARHFFLKDERPLRNWIRENITPKEDKQFSLLNPSIDWHKKYNKLLKENEELQARCAELEKKHEILKSSVLGAIDFAFDKRGSV